MRRIVLTAALALAGLISANNVNAQTFSMAHDTVKAVVWGNVILSNDVTNLTASPISVNWKVIYHNLPNSWQSLVGLCDNVSCYGNNILGTSTSTPPAPPYTPPGITKTSDTFSTTLPVHLQADFTTASAGGPYYITMELSSGATTKTMTFELTKWATGISSFNKADNNVTIYPNPAVDELNVVFDASAGVKTIAIRNMIGKVVSNYKVVGNSAKLPVSGLQSGIYFVNLTDGNGKLVAIRKFTVN